MPFVDLASDQKVWIEEKGAGKPILFVHGWPLSGEPCHKQLEGLSDEHHVLTIDLPGFDDSPPSRRPDRHDPKAWQPTTASSRSPSTSTRSWATSPRESEV